MYKLRDWIPIEKLKWQELSRNPNAIHLLEKNLDKLHNYWSGLSLNPNAIHILEKNIHHIDWTCLSLNPNSIPIFRKNIDKIHWFSISANPSIFIYDYPGMQRHFYETYGKELIETMHHPKNFEKFGKHEWYLEEE